MTDKIELFYSPLGMYSILRDDYIIRLLTEMAGIDFGLDICNEPKPGAHNGRTRARTSPTPASPAATGINIAAADR